MFAGCCYGIPSAMPFGIRYDQGSIAWDVQYTHGLIDLNAPASLAIHPVQLYQVAGCLFIAFIVWRSGHHWRASGSKFLFSVLCYGLLRFFIEFLVDPSSNSFAAELLWGLNLVQWIIVAVFCTGFIVLLIRESGTKPGAGDLESAIVPGYRRFLLAGMLCLMACMGRQWFDLLEITTISLFLIPVLFMMLFEVYKHLSVAGSRFVMPAILICCTCFMAQKSQPSGKENEKIVFAEAGLIGLIGQYYEEVSKVQNFWSDAGCTSLQDLGPSRRQFWQTGFDVSRNTWVGQYRKRSFGARLFIGSESGTIKTDYPRSELYLGISPYVNFDWKVFGFGAGFSLGQMKFPIGTKNLDSYRVGDIITVDYNNVYFMPALNARFGPVDILYAEASFPGLFPSAVPYPFFRAGVGSGLGRTNGTKAAIGYCDGIYAMIKYPVKEKLVLEALYADNLRTGTGAKRMLSVGVSYRFPSQRKPSTTDH
jgi:phosphatidylglycerol:prolipoprotein diacylglycerol transferase